MAEITLFSKHIPLEGIEGADDLLSDIALFNNIVHTACRRKTDVERNGGEVRPVDKDGNPLDMRKKENKGVEVPKSLHIQMKEKFDTDDYFTHSAVRTAFAVIKSQKKLTSLYIEDKEDVRKSVKKKRDSYNKQLNGYLKLKKSLVARSIASKKGKFKKPVMPQGGLLWYDQKHDVFCLRKLVKGDKRDVVWSWANDYLFELWLDKEIKRLQALVKNLQVRYVRLGLEIERLKTEVRGICFGSRKLFGKRDIYDTHEIWKRVWQKSRNNGMTLSGRKAATQGNFLVRYDTKTKVLTYRSQSGKDVKMKVSFPYGQEKVDKAVNAKPVDRNAIAWRFERTHGSILVKCTVHLDVEKNDYYGTGCVSFDTNVDNISFSDLDASGNIVHYETIYFDLNDKCSGHRENILSNALEKVFLYASKKHKPVVSEKLDVKRRGLTYGMPGLNKKLASFSFRIVQDLAESKSNKYELEYKKVSPAYTSQIGKVKFAKKYGISVHQAASAVIGRRALGIRERIPKWLKPFVKKEGKRFHQWQSLYPVTNEIKLKDVYRTKMC